MPTTETTSETRLCDDCGRVLPISEFRRRRQGFPARYYECRSCHNQRERERRARHQSRQERKRINDFNREILNARDDPERVQRVVLGLLHRLGGFNALVEMWTAHFQAAAPGSRAGLNACLAVFELVKFCHDRRPDPGQMSPEELEAEYLRETLALLRERPQIAIQVVQELGWKLILPGTGQAGDDAG